MNLLARLDKKIASLMPMKRARLDLPEAVVSFTFDDFPRSAYQVAGKRLEEDGMKGTYYLAPGMIDTHHLGFRQCGHQDIKELLAAGHELANHTYSHSSCIGLGKEQLVDEIGVSRSYCRDQFGTELRNFAFPLGEFDIYSKWQMARHFDSARSVIGGINKGTIDLAGLRANSIYSAGFSIDRIHRLLDEAVRENGWLVFYTHEVESDPGSFGCTPEQFASVVEAVASRGLLSMTVGEVLTRISSRH